MGYYTHFELTIHPDATAVNTNCLLRRAGLEPYKNTFSGQVKWYRFSEDMQKVSSDNPEHSFELEGWGEQTGDWWKKVWKGGQQIWSARAELPKWSPA
jgi:hypothetical protein